MIVDVVCAFIVKDSGVFLAQRGANASNPYKWEFPGGKIQPGEDCKAAIVREMNEEFSVTVNPVMVLSGLVHHYVHISVNLIPVLCQTEASEFVLHEHIACGFFPLRDIESMDLSDADRKVLYYLHQMLHS
jgi:8-oxo-dGTP diphosphatase